MSIREKIIQYLEKNNRKTIKEIAKSIQEQENVVRTKIFDKKYGLIQKGIIVKVSHEKRTGYFSLAKNFIDQLKALKQLHSIMKNKMDFIEKPDDNEIRIIEAIERLIK